MVINHSFELLWECDNNRVYTDIFVGRETPGGKYLDPETRHSWVVPLGEGTRRFSVHLVPVLALSSEGASDGP